MNDANIAKPTSARTRKEREAFVAFTMHPESAAVLRQFCEKMHWSPDCVKEGDVDTAVEFLKSNPAPVVLFIDLPSAETAAASLDRLADVCDPSIKVIASGFVNEYSFYISLVNIGIPNYLLKPFNLAALEAIFAKLTEAQNTVTGANGVPVPEGKVIAVLGMRGGSGATTVAVNLAWALAHHHKQKVALLDFDPQLGSVALAMDLEPGKGLREALEKPERIDALFMERVMVKVDEQISVLSTEEPLEASIHTREEAAEALFKQTKSKFSYVVVDVPRIPSEFTQYAITHADYFVAVTEFTIMGLRESLRYMDYCREFKRTPPVFIANRVGLAGKQQMPEGEFEKGLGAKIAYKIPFALEAYATATTGEVIVQRMKNSAIAKALMHAADHFIEVQDGPKADTPKAKNMLSFMKGKK